jgi:hypothetical protein
LVHSVACESSTSAAFYHTYGFLGQKKTGYIRSHHAVVKYSKLNLVEKDGNQVVVSTDVVGGAKLCPPRCAYLFL